jgi:hypothetical protein
MGGTVNDDDDGIVLSVVVDTVVAAAMDVEPDARTVSSIMTMRDTGPVASNELIKQRSARQAKVMAPSYRKLLSFLLACCGDGLENLMMAAAWLWKSDENQYVCVCV